MSQYKFSKEQVAAWVGEGNLKRDKVNAGAAFSALFTTALAVGGLAIFLVFNWSWPPALVFSAVMILIALWIGAIIYTVILFGEGAEWCVSPAVTRLAVIWPEHWSGNVVPIIVKDGTEPLRDRVKPIPLSAIRQHAEISDLSVYVNIEGGISDLNITLYRPPYEKWGELGDKVRETLIKEAVSAGDNAQAEQVLTKAVRGVIALAIAVFNRGGNVEQAFDDAMAYLEGVIREMKRAVADRRARDAATTIPPAPPTPHTPPPPPPPTGRTP